MKKLLTNNAISRSIFLLFIALIVNLLWFKIVNDYYYIILVLDILIIYFLIKKYRNEYRIYYNTHNLILTNQQGERKINFKDIKQITRKYANFRILGIYYYEYQIHFINEDSQSEKISFYISSIDNSMAEFQKFVALARDDNSL